MKKLLFLQSSYSLDNINFGNTTYDRTTTSTDYNTRKLFFYLQNLDETIVEMNTRIYTRFLCL
jgi:hypothetical protein